MMDPGWFVGVSALAAIALSPLQAGAQVLTSSAAPACRGTALARPVSTTSVPSIGVLYFAGGSTHGDDPQLAEAVTAEVAGALSRAVGVAVVRGDQWLDPSVSPSYVLTGHVARARNDLTVRVRLNEGSSGSMVWNSEFTGPVTTLPVIGSSIAAEVARHAGAVPDTATPPPIALPLNAYDQILLGEYNLVRWDDQSMQRAVQALAVGTGLASGDPVSYARYGLALGKMGEWGYRGPATADSMLAWGSLVSELAANRELEAGRTAAAADGYGWAASMSALRSDVQRARALALRADSLARGQPGAVRALSLLDLPSNPAAASTRLRAAEGSASGPLLVDRAMLALTARRDAEACEVLDEAIAMDPRSAPAFALRALVRMRNGDMRGGWSDAEMARQLGRPAWGDALEILAASRVSERQELLTRLERYVRSVRADSTEISVLDARLAFIALSAAGRDADARRVLARMRFSDPRRNLTLGEGPPSN